MRTLIAGLGAFRRNPVSIVPITAEGLCVALAILLGILPARASVAAAAAAFPLDVYFDVKHALGASSSWTVLAVVVIVSVVVRSAVLALTLSLADGERIGFVASLRAAFPVVGISALAFLPVAVVFFAGAALRYAPFIWVAAPIGFAIATIRARKGVALDVGSGTPRGESTPETAPFLAYACLVASSGAAISYLGDRSIWLAALLVLSVAPLHALFLLGWRENARAEVYPGGGVAALTATAVIAGMLGVGTFYDRIVRSPSPVARTQGSGSIALLGGADSTSETGALTEVDVRSLGYREERAHLLSYTTSGGYAASDTRVDLDSVARKVVPQLRRIPDLEGVVGHSQAALIVDRILAAGVELPGVVSFAPPPPRPPHLTLPPPGRTGRGKPGGDLARLLARGLRSVGAAGFDIDSPASPTRLEAVVVSDVDVPRLSIWPLADAVWLDGDWRRPGEVNVVAITDHVGVTQNGRALGLARDFLTGRSVAPDSASWRAFLVPVVRYAFEVWRPENR